MTRLPQHHLIQPMHVLFPLSWHSTSRRSFLPLLAQHQHAPYLTLQLCLQCPNAQCCLLIRRGVLLCTGCSNGAHHRVSLPTPGRIQRLVTARPSPSRHRDVLSRSIETLEEVLVPLLGRFNYLTATRFPLVSISVYADGGHMHTKTRMASL